MPVCLTHFFVLLFIFCCHFFSLFVTYSLCFMCFFCLLLDLTSKHSIPTTPLKWFSIFVCFSAPPASKKALFIHCSMDLKAIHYACDVRSYVSFACLFSVIFLCVCVVFLYDFAMLEYCGFIPFKEYCDFGSILLVLLLKMLDFMRI